MIARILNILTSVLFAFSVLISALVFAVLYTLHTETGSRWLITEGVNWYREQADDELDIGAIEGSILYGLSVRDLRYASRDDEGSLEVNVGRLAFAWRPWTILAGELSLLFLEIEGLHIDVQDESEMDGDDDDFDLAALFDDLFGLPLTLRIDNASVSDASLTLGQERHELARLALWARLGDGAMALDYVGLEALGAEVSLSILLRQESLALDASGQWRFDSDEQSLGGNLAISGNLQQLQLRHELLSPLPLISEGSVRLGLLDGAPIEFDFGHRAVGLVEALELPPPLQMVEATVQTRGSPDEIALEAAVDVEVEGLEALRISLQGSFAGEQLQISRLAVDSPMLAWEADGILALEPTLDLALDWRLLALDYEDLESGFSLADVNAVGTLGFAIPGDEAVVDLAVTWLDGNLNQFPFSADAALLLSGEMVEQLVVNFAVSDNLISIAGSLGDSLALTWSVQAPRLDAFLPGLSGTIEGRGEVSGSLEAPEISGRLNGDEFRYLQDGSEVRLEGLSMLARYQGNANNIALSLRRLSHIEGDERLDLDSLDMSLVGDPAQHRFSLNLHAPGLATLALDGGGGLEEQTWRGGVDRMRVDTDYGELRLEAPLALTAAAESASFGEHCWAFASVRLCAAGNWNQTQGLSANATLNGLSLGYLNDAQAVANIDEPALRELLAARPPGIARLLTDLGISLGEDIFIDGDVRAIIAVNGVAGADTVVPVLDATLNIDGWRVGMITLDEAEAMSMAPEINVFQFSDPALRLSWRDGDWNFSTDFRVFGDPSTGALDLQGFFQAQANLHADGSLAGGFVFDFQDIAWLESLVAEISNASGEFRAQGDIGGTLEVPLLQAEIRMVDMRFDVPEFGLEISDLNVRVASDENNDISVLGSVQSGGGLLNFSSEIRQPLQAERNMSFSLQGQNFVVMNLEDRQAVITPDITLFLSEESIDFNGRIDVPRLYVNLEGAQDIVDSGTSVSSDVQVVNGQGRATEQGLLQRIPVQGRLSLGLGDDVRFEGFGLAVRLAGNLDVEQTTGRPLLTYGEVAIVEGLYAIYGQELRVENGKLIFFGNMLNPALDIRAFRIIRQSSAPGAQEMIAGVQINGTLTNMESQLFSTPALPESEVLAMLITGKSFQNIDGEDGDTMLATIANLGIDRGQGLTDTVRGKLGLDTMEVSGGSNLTDSSLGLGKFITPSLFMRYNIGLFDRQSNLSVDYFLTEKVRLEVRTGISQSVDITYTLER